MVSSNFYFFIWGVLRPFPDRKAATLYSELTIQKDNAVPPLIRGLLNNPRIHYKAYTNVFFFFFHNFTSFLRVFI